MAKNKKKSGEKLIFTIVILVFVFSSVLAYSSVALRPPSTNQPIQTSDQTDLLQNDFQNNKNITSEQLNDLIQKNVKSAPQGLEGVIKKLEPGTYSEGTHFLEANGVTLAILESDGSMDLDKYVGKNVKVFGESRMVTEGDGAIMKVTKIEIAN